MSKHGIFATLLHYRANTVLLKNLPRWRADTIRPYMAYPLKLHSYNKTFAAVIRWNHPYMACKNRPPWAVLQKGKEVTCRSAWYKTELFGSWQIPSSVLAVFSLTQNCGNVK